MKPINSDNPMENILNGFEVATDNPEIYLTYQKKKENDIKILLKTIYDHGKQAEEKRRRDKALPELLIQDMDEEQIWQQIELQNNSIFTVNLKKVSTVLSVNDSKLKFNYTTTDNVNEEESDEDEEADNENNINLEEIENENEDRIKLKKKSSKEDKKFKNSKGRSSLDDNFFNLDEMNDYLESEEKREMSKFNGKGKSNLSDIDFFASNSDSDDGKVEDMHYSGFFGAKEDDEEDYQEDEDENQDEENDADDDENDALDENGLDDSNNKKSVTFNLKKNRTWKPLPRDYDENKNYDDYHEENEVPHIEEGLESAEPKSTFEIRQDRLKQKIEQLEEKALDAKPWQLRGEVNAENRPQNSLLEEILEFDSTMRPAPLITEETTQRLEDIIIQRIRDKAFDDVERKIKPANDPREYRKEIVLNQEKSKESLAQIYEKEFLKQTGQEDQKDDEEPKEHKEIKKHLQSIFMKLDALSNFHYTPRPAKPEVRIITNTPAIAMEEVAPISVSDRALLAPEEIKNKAKGDIMSKEERTRTDKKRERRLKKVFQKNKQKRIDDKERENESKGIVPKSKDMKKKLLDKVVKSRNVEKMVESGDTKALKSSTAFFSQLQDNSTKVKKNNPKKFKENKLSAVRVKL